MKKSLFLGAILIFSLLLTDAVYACSCRRRMTSEQYFTYSPVVFIGKFQESRRGYNRSQTINATFRVDRVLKGEIKAGDSVTISTAYHSPMCGISNWANETPGALWIVYAGPVPTNTVPPGKILATSICSGTSPLSR